MTHNPTGCYTNGSRHGIDFNISPIRLALIEDDLNFMPRNSTAGYQLKPSTMSFATTASVCPYTPVPVAPKPQPTLRSALLVGAAGVIVALALAVGVIWLVRSGTDVDIRLGDRDFRHLDADRISTEIRESGPLLFPDLAGGNRDLILQHHGDDPEQGWTAFDARRPGQDRGCFFQWQMEETNLEARFVNTCNPSDVVDAVGTSLTHYPVVVTDGDVRIDINNPVTDPAETEEMP